LRLLEAAAEWHATVNVVQWTYHHVSEYARGLRAVTSGTCAGGGVQRLEMEVKYYVVEYMVEQKWVQSAGSYQHIGSGMGMKGRRN